MFLVKIKTLRASQFVFIFENSRHIMVVRLSAPCTDCLYPPGGKPSTRFCWRLSRSQGHSRARRINSMTNPQWPPRGMEPATFRLVAQCPIQLRQSRLYKIICGGWGEEKYSYVSNIIKSWVDTSVLPQYFLRYFGYEYINSWRHWHKNINPLSANVKNMVSYK